MHKKMLMPGEQDGLQVQVQLFFIKDLTQLMVILTEQDSVE
jgi:hypothetical protein